jgi:hypothetical protein
MRSKQQHDIRVQMNGMEKGVAALLGIEDRKIASSQASTLTGRHPTSRIETAQSKRGLGHGRAYHHEGVEN